MGTALLLLSVPEFWLGFVLLLLFASDIGKFKIFPGAGSYVGLTYDPWKWFTSLILPWIVLAAGSAAVYARLMRSSLSETMREDYIRTARAKGLRERAVVRQGLRSAINPIATSLGLEIGVLLGTAVIVETVFNIPGIGSIELQSDRVVRFSGGAGNGPDCRGVHHLREHRRRYRLRVSRTASALLMSAAEPLLRVEDLRVEFPTEDGVVHAVDGITYQVFAGRTLGIVGESGSGKTVSSLTTLGLTRRQGARVSGRILFDGEDLLDAAGRPAASDPGQRHRDDLPGPAVLAASAVQGGIAVDRGDAGAPRRSPRQQARERAIELLGLVGIPDPHGASMSTRTSSRAACASAR